MRTPNRVPRHPPWTTDLSPGASFSACLQLVGKGRIGDGVDQSSGNLPAFLTPKGPGLAQSVALRFTNTHHLAYMLSL